MLVLLLGSAASLAPAGSCSSSAPSTAAAPGPPSSSSCSAAAVLPISSPPLPFLQLLLCSLSLSLASGGGGAQGKRGLGRLGFRGCDAGGFIGAQPWLGGARTPMDGCGRSARFVDAWRHRSGARARLGFDARAGERSREGRGGLLSLSRSGGGMARRGGGEQSRRRRRREVGEKATGAPGRWAPLVIG